MDRALHHNVFENYHPLRNVYDELFSKSNAARPEFSFIIKLFSGLTREDFVKLHKQAQNALTERGVTFSVFSEKNGFEKIFPFDLLPKVFLPSQWEMLDKGLQQRIKALNAFLVDIYSTQNILRDNIIPRDIVLSSPGYISKVHGILPREGVYIHVAGTDIIRNTEGRLVVLEDNLRVPSGVSYALENRRLMEELFPSIFNSIKIQSISDYPLQLKQALHSLSKQENPFMVVLTPGSYNSAYFEHVYLAKKMDCPLVQGNDLYTENNKVYLRTENGAKQVDVIYRRVDDDFLDPSFFREDSLLGVNGLVQAYKAGHVVLANGLGNGVADDKAIYPHVPAMIRYYLQEEPILQQVTTYSCFFPKDCQYVLEHLASLVVKPTNQSGGYGIFIGPQASKKELKEMYDKIKQNPRVFIAQPLEELSTCPTLNEDSTLYACRTDFRPYIVTGKSSWVLPGGLTRVALRPHSYIVNSCQGGGSKDTWVLQ